MADFIHLLRRLEGYVQARGVALPSTAAADNAIHHHLRQIDDHLYAVHSPSERPVLVDMVFFHGLQLEGSQEAHISTWVSEDQNLWLNWILEEFCNARIFVVSYDAHTERTGEKGRMDMYVTCENLLQCFVGEGAQVGQLGCPVVLVGHCIGGLVMKQLCVYADRVAQDSRNVQPVQRLLDNIKGLFFFSCPHQGTRLSDMSTNYAKGPLFEDISTLRKEAARQNMEFQKVRRRERYGWRTYGVGESREATLLGFRGIIVEEASARVDMDGFYTCDADHFNICQPSSKTSSSFTHLSSFIKNILKEKGAEAIDKPIPSDGGSCSRDPEQPEITNSEEGKDTPMEEQMDPTAKWPKETRADQSRQSQPGVVVNFPRVQEHNGARLVKSASLNLRQRRRKGKSVGQQWNPQKEKQHNELPVKDTDHAAASPSTIHKQMPMLGTEINVANPEQRPTQGPELASGDFSRTAVEAPVPRPIPLFHEVHEQMPGLRYIINDEPIWPEAIALGLQNYIVNLGTVVLFVNAIVPQMGGDDDDKARVLQNILFVSALNTLIQTFFGSRLPVVMGVSFAYVVPILNIIKSPELASIPDPHQRFEHTMRAIQGAQILASSVQIVLGFSGFWKWFTCFLSPIAMAPIVVLTAVVGNQYGFPEVAKSMEIALPTIILALVISQYLWHLKIKIGRWYYICSLFPILLTLTIINAGQMLYYTKWVDATEPSDSWVKVPYAFEFGPPTFDVSHAFCMMCAAVVSTVESTGAFWAAYRLSGATPPPPKVISRGIGWAGIGVFLNGVFATAAGTTASIENIGLMGITRVGSRRVIQTSALWMAFFSLYGKFGVVFASIPVPIFAGFSCFLLGIVAAVGISSLHFVNVNKTRNLFIVGFALYMGFSVPSYCYQYRASADYATAHSRFNDIANVFLSSGAVVALLITSILDNTIRRHISPKDRGMHWFTRFHHFSGDPRNEEFYGFRNPLEALSDWWADL